uniref:Chemokine interleukin-8-like domain-containing protein n=1 Tax=Leptobrachium leishanense TaxID=445787 RepID=A0A8C5LLU7_9ANUR
MQTQKKVLLFLIICLACSTVSRGMPAVARMSELRCNCISTETKFISPKHFQNVEIIPKGPHCKHVEVIVTLKNGVEVCLEPSTPWVKRVVDKILDSTKTTTALPQR